MMKDISIIIPCYNEGFKLNSNIQKIVEYLGTIHPLITKEIVLVNDGSTDNTNEIINIIANKIHDVKTVSYEKNRGKGYAIKMGMQKSEAEWLIFMDADLSTDLSALSEVLLQKENADFIIGSRRFEESILVKEQGAMRKIVGSCCSILTNIIIPLGIKDTQCGFKAIKAECAKVLIEKQKVERFAFDVEYLYICKLRGLVIKEIPVIWENDEDSKVTVFNSSIDFFKDLICIRSRKRYYLK